MTYYLHLIIAAQFGSFVSDEMLSSQKAKNTLGWKFGPKK